MIGLKENAELLGNRGTPGLELGALGRISLTVSRQSSDPPLKPRRVELLPQACSPVEGIRGQHVGPKSPELLRQYVSTSVVLGETREEHQHKGC